MPLLYSPEWVSAFNAAVAGLDVVEADTGASLRATEGSFRVAQVVHGVPEREDLRVVLSLADGHLAMEVEPTGDTAVEPTRAAVEPTRHAAVEPTGDTAVEPTPPPAAEPVNVTLSIAYEDAAALSRGELDPAALVGTGRVRVRGDLAVLVAAQGLLAAAAPLLAGLQAATSY